MLRLFVPVGGGLVEVVVVCTAGAGTLAGERVGVTVGVGLGLGGEGVGGGAGVGDGLGAGVGVGVGGVGAGGAGAGGSGVAGGVTTVVGAVGAGAGGETTGVLGAGRSGCGAGRDGGVTAGGGMPSVAPGRLAPGATITCAGPICVAPAGGFTGTVTRPGRETANVTATAPVAMELRGSTTTARCRSGPGIAVKCAPGPPAFRPSKKVVGDIPLK